MGLGGFVLGSLILYLKGMRRMMFQLSGFYYRVVRRMLQDFVGSFISFYTVLAEFYVLSGSSRG